MLNSIKKWLAEKQYLIVGNLNLQFISGEITGKEIFKVMANQNADNSISTDSDLSLNSLGKKMSSPAKGAIKKILYPVLIHEETGESFAIYEDGVTVGRGCNCWQRFEDSTVSDMHFKINQKYGKYILNDLGSKNGTRVNNKRVVSTCLADGDKIAAGKTNFIFKLLTGDDIKLLSKHEPSYDVPISKEILTTTDAVSNITLPPPSVTTGLTIEEVDELNLCLKTQQETEIEKAPDVVSNNDEELFAERTDELKIKIGQGHQGEEIVWRPEVSDTEKLDNWHLLIVGSSGTGKTQCVKNVVNQLWRQKVTALIFDFNDDYITDDFVAATHANVIDVLKGINLNPLELSKDACNGNLLSPKLRRFEIAAILKEVFHLGDQQHRLLVKSVKALYNSAGMTNDVDTWKNDPPDFNLIPEFIQSCGTQCAHTDSLLNRIDPLFDMEIFSAGATYSFNSLLNGVTVIRLSHLPGIELKLAVSRFILQKIYNFMIALGHSSKIRNYVVIDEAHKLMNNASLTGLVKESRKFGLGIILASQEVTDFHRSILANTGTKLILKLPYSKDAKAMTEQLGLNKDKLTGIQQSIQNYPPFAGLFKNNHYHPYIEINVDPFYKNI